MALNQQLIGKVYKDMPPITITREAALAFAAATTGDGDEVLEAYRDGNLVPPMFGVSFSFGVFGAVLFDPALRVDMMRLLHGEQAMHFDAPVRPGDVITTVGTVEAVVAKSTGELLEVGLTSTNQRGEVVLRCKSGLFIRLPRSQHTKKGPPTPPPPAPPSPPPSFSRAIRVAADQSRRYADASGDRNPIHLDNEVAAQAGLPGIILHGLCSMAFAHNAVAEHWGGDPLAVASLAVRFQRPVLMGDTLTVAGVSSGSSPEALSLTMTNQEDMVVLGQGEATRRNPS